MGRLLIIFIHSFHASGLAEVKSYTYCTIHYLQQRWPPSDSTSEASPTWPLHIHSLHALFYYPSSPPPFQSSSISALFYYPSSPPHFQSSSIQFSLHLPNHHSFIKPHVHLQNEDHQACPPTCRLLVNALLHLQAHR